MKSPRLLSKNFSNPDEVLTFPKGKDDNLSPGELTVGRFVQQPDWRWSEQIKPIAGAESCQFHHVGVAGPFDSHGQRERVAHFARNPFRHPTRTRQSVVGDEPAVSILWGGWRGFGKPPVGERVLTTMLMTDMARSTERVHRGG